MKVKVRRRLSDSSKMDALLRTPKWQRAMKLVEQWDRYGPPLTPSPHGRECLGNGSWPGYPCQCPGCDWYPTICFPDYAADDD